MELTLHGEINQFYSSNFVQSMHVYSSVHLTSYFLHGIKYTAWLQSWSVTFLHRLRIRIDWIYTRMVYLFTKKFIKSLLNCWKIHQHEKIFPRWVLDKILGLSGSLKYRWTVDRNGFFSREIGAYLSNPSKFNVSMLPKTTPPLLVCYTSHPSLLYKLFEGSIRVIILKWSAQLSTYFICKERHLTLRSLTGQ